MKHDPYSTSPRNLCLGGISIYSQVNLMKMTLKFYQSQANCSTIVIWYGLTKRQDRIITTVQNPISNIGARAVKVFTFCFLPNSIEMTVIAVDWVRWHRDGDGFFQCACQIQRCVAIAGDPMRSALRQLITILFSGRVASPRERMRDICNCSLRLNLNVPFLLDERSHPLHSKSILNPHLTQSSRPCCQILHYQASQHPSAPLKNPIQSLERRIRQINQEFTSEYTFLATSLTIALVSVGVKVSAEFSGPKNSLQFQFS